MNKNLKIATGILLVGAVAVALSDQIMNKPDGRLGKPVVPISQVIGLDAIKFVKGDKSVSLVMGKDNVWRIGTEAGFPADAAKISRLVDDLTKMDVQVLASSAKEPAPEFGLNDATELSLKKGDTDLVRVKLAGQRDRGGQFIAFGSDPKVYLISQNIEGSADESVWELKRLLNISSSQVKKIEFKPSKGSSKKAVTLSRTKSEDAIKAEKLPNSAKESTTIRSHEGVLSGVDFVTKGTIDSAEAKKALANPNSVTVTLFDGRVFDVSIGSIGEPSKKYFMHIAAKKGETTAETDIKEVDWINSIMNGYTFEISSMMATRFEKGLEDMIEKKTSKS
jgi:hypothetical protein